MLETQVSLSEKEIGVLLDLLREEQHELPVEIRHTRSSGYHTELLARQTLINSLVERLEKELQSPAA